MCQEFESLQAHQYMAGVAQLVRAPDCGPGGREFDSRRPPHYFLPHWGVAKWLRHRILIPAFVGSNPATPATQVEKQFLAH